MPDARQPASTRISRVIDARPEDVCEAFIDPAALVAWLPPGEMTLVATFEPVPGGTEVTLLFENLPPGLRPEDNEEGSRQSLEQLARRFEDGAGPAQGRESQSAGSAKGGRK